MSEKEVPTDYCATMQRVTLAEAWRAYIAVQEVRHVLLRAHMKAVEDEVRSIKRLLQRVSTSSEPATLQASVAQLLADRMEHQAALYREYARAFADGWSAWLAHCQAFQAPWLTSARPGAEPSDPTGLNGLTTAWGSFYDQLGKMSSMLAGTAPVVPPSNGSGRSRVPA